MIQSDKPDMQDQRDRSDLHVLIEKFAAPVSSATHGHSSLPPSPGEQLSVLLREIDETVLPRRLTIMRDGSDFAYLDISNRRLVGINRVNGKVTRKSDTMSDASYCADILLSLVQPSPELTFAMTYRPADYKDVGISCSCVMLKEALGLGGSDNSFIQIERRISSGAQAMLHWTHGDRTGTFFGDQVWQPTLEQARAALYAQKSVTERVSHLPQADLRSFVMPYSETGAIVLVQQNDKGLAAVMALDTALQVLGNWRISHGATAS